MKVKDIMTENPVCCTKNTNLQEVAQMMVEHDCGAIPVVESKGNMKPLGVVTDRDIVCRVIAKGKNPLQMNAGDCMSTPLLTVKPEMDVDDCCKLMEQRQVRRILVVDESGRCCGIVAQADIARKAPEEETADVVKEISQPVS